MSIDVKQIPSFIAGWLSWLLGQIITWGVLLLIVAAILQRYGVRQSLIPTINVTDLVWLCGAVWLAREARSDDPRLRQRLDTSHTQAGDREHDPA